MAPHLGTLDMTLFCELILLGDDDVLFGRAFIAADWPKKSAC